MAHFMLNNQRVHVKSPIIHHMLFFRLQQNSVKYQHLRISRLQFRDPWISQILTLFAQPRSTVCGKSKQRVARSNLWFYAILRLVSFFLFLSFLFFWRVSRVRNSHRCWISWTTQESGPIESQHGAKIKPKQLEEISHHSHHPFIVDFDPCNSLQEIHLIFLNLQSNLSFHGNVQTFNKNTVGLSPFVFWKYLPIFVNLSLLNSTTTIQNLQSESPQISIWITILCCFFRLDFNKILISLEFSLELPPISWWLRILRIPRP